MTLTQMRYFYEVCKWRSITKAAASLHISQPTVSIAMADLEKESGLNLFRREGKKLSLTEDGSLLLSKITPILANLQQLDRDIKDMAQNKNLIRLAVPLQIGVQLLPTLFRDFKNLYPEIELEVVEAGGIDSLRMIENEELDLAVTNYDDSFSPNLHYRKLFKSEACFSAPILTIRWRRKNMSIPKILPTNLWYCLTVVFSSIASSIKIFSRL